jgi:hypothetical protein
LGNDLFIFGMSSVNFVIVEPEISYPEFIRLLTEQFPTIKSAVLDASRSDLIYLQVSCLTDYANACLKNNQSSEFARAVDFFQQTVEKADRLTEDALYLNFLGDLQMSDNNPVGCAARALLKPEYLRFWAEWRARYFGENYLVNYLNTM